MPERYWEDDTIKAAPIYTLSECAVLSPRIFDADDLSDMEGLTDGLKERFHTALLLCDEAQLAVVRMAAELSADQKPLTEFLPYDFRPFHNNGFVYLFSWEDSDYLVLPDELARVYEETFAEDDFVTRNQHNVKLGVYAKALINLYGAYEIEWFVEVWNHHHRDKIEYKEAEQFLSDQTYFQSDYYFYDGFVVHDCLFDDDFEELLEEAGDLDYYMPTKSVIAFYTASDDYYEKTPGAKEMNAFLAGLITNDVKLDNLQLEISISCERLESPIYVRECLKEAGFPLDNAEAVAKFEKLFQNLRDNTHIWELRGFTPYQYETETGKRLKRFALPEAKPIKQKGKRKR